MYEGRKCQVEAEVACQPSTSRGLARRRFLLGTGACIAGVSGLVLESAAAAEASPASAAPASPISIGYWEGSEQAGTLAAGRAGTRARFRADVIPATRVDPQPVDQVSLTVYGLGGVAPQSPEPVGLTVYYQLEDGGEAPFYAWSFGNTSTANSSAPVTFDLSASPVKGLAFGLAPGGAAQAAGQDVKFSFGQGAARGGAKLRSGIYFVAFGEPQRVNALNWNRFQFREDPTEPQTGRRLFRNVLNRGPVPAEFYYLVLGVEPAGD